SPSNQLNWIPQSLDQAIADLKSAAQKTVNRASLGVKIGILGEFSSGKTYLLSSLVGYGDFLPISENPTTGNVTAIHITQQANLQTTKIANWTVEYLDEQGVKECLIYMVNEAIKRAKNININTDAIAANKTDFNGVMQWCKMAWNQTQNLELRYLIRELVIFISVYQSYHQAFCGKIFQIDTKTAKEGLQLPDPHLNIQSLQFEELIPGYATLPTTPKQLTILLLQKSFPLIKRVDVEVQISPEIWDLSQLQGVTELILLDFPGLGAANSGVRDEYLSLRELAEVQTILILADGRRPGSGGANKIFTMMQQNKGEQLKDRILVGVGRFDQLPVEEQILDNLLLQNNLLTEETVLENIKTLKTTIASAKALIPDNKTERIVLLSPLLGLAETGKISQNIQIGSDNFALANTTFAKQIQTKWGELSNKLVMSELKQQLAYFGEDGGITKLRTLILDHVVKHGLKQLITDSYSGVKEIVQTQAKIKNILEEITLNGRQIEVPPEVEKLREIIRNLVNTYRQFQTQLKQKPLQTKKGIEIDEEVQNKLIAEIHNWSEWNSLFNKLNNGQIVVSKSDDIMIGILGGNIFEDNIPTKSQDFLSPFQTTLQKLETFARDKISESIEHNFKQLSQKIVNERDNLRAIIPQENQEEISREIQKFGPNDVGLFRLLITSDDPVNKWLTPVIKNSQIQQDTNLTLDGKKIFPLLPDQQFDWGGEMNNQASAINHQILL
ncbi:MAG TPA: dynamin family protein, partial [Allocoleopsis sp.]